MSKWMRGLHYLPKTLFERWWLCKPLVSWFVFFLPAFFFKLPEMTTQNRKLWVKCMHDRLQIRPAAALCSSFACVCVITQKCGKRGSQTSRNFSALISTLHSPHTTAITHLKTRCLSYQQCIVKLFVITLQLLLKWLLAIYV